MLTKDFQCVTGWRVPDVKWTGVLLSDLLDRAGVKPEGEGAAVHVVRRRVHREPHARPGAPRRRDRRVRAGGQAGVDATTAARCGSYVAPMYGYKSCKWLDGIEVVDHVIPGYWEDNGYDVDGWVGKSNGRDDQPTS